MTLAWLLRAAGWKNSWIVAGICVGVFFGPLCAAKAFPDMYQLLIDGCGEARAEVLRSQRATEALMLAAATTRTVPAESVVIELDALRQSAEINLRESRSAFDHGALWVVALLAAIVTLARSPVTGRVRWWKNGGLAIGAWTVLIPISVVFLVAKIETQEVLTRWSLIAAAIVGDPAILLLDEATSALDNATQAVVMSTILKSSATRIVIAHRLSTIRQADRVLVIADGTIVESGSPAELLESGGLFSKLAARQEV